MKIGRYLAIVVAATIMLLVSSCTTVANHPPVITSLKAEREVVAASGTCQIECVASDEDGDKLSYEWSASGGNISGTGPVVTWTAPQTVSAYSIGVTVTDGYGGKDTASLTVNVALNTAPIVESLVATADHRYLAENPGGYKILQEYSCEIKCTASDPKGGELSYKWSADRGTISGEGSKITWTAPLGATTVTVSVTVSNSIGSAATKSLVFKVEDCAPCAFGSA